MENLFLILESPVVLLIAGALIGFIPSYFLNKQNNKHAETMHNNDKKREIYVSFLELGNCLIAQEVAIQNKTGFASDFFHNKIVDLLSNANKIIASINLLGKRKIALKCSKFMQNQEYYCKGHQDEFVKDYEEIINLMRKDLGIEE